ncbi:MAG: methyltransferase domain-containing protein [Proteiniphilum sp.]|nr:methyltransferase domain-containing protein [Proteiniphilum sp.]
MQTDNRMTDRAHWDAYWANYRYDKIPDKVVFQKYMKMLRRGDSFIEIGGFPGLFAAWFYKQGITDVTVLDFHMEREIVRKLEKINGLKEDSIQCIHTDFFTFKSEKKYDVVFSSGFIEHFEDTRDVIKRHVELLSENGQMLILIPNFLGLNGKIQQRLDKENIDAHNLRSMEIRSLKEMMRSFNLHDVKVEYIGKPMVWLEPKPGNRSKQKWVKCLSYIIKLFPVRGRMLSPFIAIYAAK